MAPLTTPQTLQKLRGLASGPRTWLTVNRRPSKAAAAPDAAPANAGVCTTLADALERSRPGQTIVVEEDGQGPHRVDRVLRITWPLRVQGQEPSGGAVRVRGATGLEALFVTTAPAVLSGVELESRAGACIVHEAGPLRLHRCTLSSQAWSYGHLVSQLVTRAALPRGGRLSAQDIQLQVRMLDRALCPGVSCPWPQHTCLGLFSGRIVGRKCKGEGGRVCA